MASRTPTKKRATPASARVTDSSKKSGKKFGGFAYAGADAAPRRALNFVDDGSASDDDDIFVPVATHKLVGYKREGETEPAPHAAAIFDLARRVCVVPRDFEAQHRYGPKSGICHEERVANAYLAGMLEGGDEELRRSLKRLVDRREYAEAVELCAAN